MRPPLPIEILKTNKKKTKGALELKHKLEALEEILCKVLRNCIPTLCLKDKML